MVECGGGSCILNNYVVVVVYTDRYNLPWWYIPTSADTCTYAFGGPIAFCTSSTCVVYGSGVLCIVVVEY